MFCRADAGPQPSLSLATRWSVMRNRSPGPFLHIAAVQGRFRQWVLPVALWTQPGSQDVPVWSPNTPGTGTVAATVNQTGPHCCPPLDRKPYSSMQRVTSGGTTGPDRVCTGVCACMRAQRKSEPLRMATPSGELEFWGK